MVRYGTGENIAMATEALVIDALLRQARRAVTIANNTVSALLVRCQAAYNESMPWPSIPTVTRIDVTNGWCYRHYDVRMPVTLCLAGGCREEGCHRL